MQQAFLYMLYQLMFSFKIYPPSIAIHYYHRLFLCFAYLWSLIYCLLRLWLYFCKICNKISANFYGTEKFTKNHIMLFIYSCTKILAKYATFTHHDFIDHVVWKCLESQTQNYFFGIYIKFGFKNPLILTSCHLVDVAS